MDEHIFPSCRNLTMMRVCRMFYYHIHVMLLNFFFFSSCSAYSLCISEINRTAASQQIISVFLRMLFPCHHTYYLLVLVRQIDSLNVIFATEKVKLLTVSFWG